MPRRASGCPVVPAPLRAPPSRVDDHPEPVPLVARRPPEGKDRSARLRVEVRRVVGRLAVAVEHPPVRDRLAAVELDPDLALGHGAGGHVEHDRGLRVSGRDADGDRVRRQTALGAPPGGDDGSPAVGVGHKQSDLLLMRHLLDVGPKPADMVAAADGHRGEPALPRFGNPQLDGAAGDNLAESPVAVEGRRGRRFRQNLDLSSGHHLPVLDPLQVLGHPDDAVGIVAEPVRLDEAAGDGCGLRSGDLCSLEKVPAGFGKVIGMQKGHAGSWSWAGSVSRDSEGV